MMFRICCSGFRDFIVDSKNMFRRKKILIFLINIFLYCYLHTRKYFRILAISEFCPLLALQTIFITGRLFNKHIDMFYFPRKTSPFSSMMSFSIFSPKHSFSTLYFLKLRCSKLFSIPHSLRFTNLR